MKLTCACFFFLALCLESVVSRAEVVRVVGISSRAVTVQYDLSSFRLQNGELKLSCRGKNTFRDADGEEEIAHSTSVQFAAYNADTIMMSELEPYTRYSCTLFHISESEVEVLTDMVHFTTSYSYPEPPPVPHLEAVSNSTASSSSSSLYALHFTLAPTSTRYGPVRGYELQFFVVLETEATAGRISHPYHHQLGHPDGLRDSLAEAMDSEEPLDFAYRRFSHQSLPMRVVVDPSLLGGALKAGTTYATVLLAYTNDTMKNHVFFSASNFSEFFTVPKSSKSTSVVVQVYNYTIRNAIIGAVAVLLLAGFVAVCFIIVWRSHSEPRPRRSTRLRSFRPSVFGGPGRYRYSRVDIDDSARDDTPRQEGYRFGAAMKDFQRDVFGWGRTESTQSPDVHGERFAMKPPEIVIHDTPSDKESARELPPEQPPSQDPPALLPSNSSQNSHLNPIPSESHPPICSHPHRKSSHKGKSKITVATPAPGRTTNRRQSVSIRQIVSNTDSTSSGCTEEKGHDGEILNVGEQLQPFKTHTALQASGPFYPTNTTNQTTPLVYFGETKEEGYTSSGFYGSSATMQDFSRMSDLALHGQLSSQPLAVWSTPFQPQTQGQGHRVPAAISDFKSIRPFLHRASTTWNASSQVPTNAPLEHSQFAYNVATMYDREFNNSGDGLNRRYPDKQQLGPLAREWSNELIDFMSYNCSIPQPIPQQPSLKQPSVKQPSVEQLFKQPSVEQLLKQPSVEQPSVKQPSVEQPSLKQPSVEQPSVKQPSVEQLFEQPSVEQPSVKQPSVEQLFKQPSVEQPSVKQPSVGQLFKQRSVEQPSVKQPSVEQLSTVKSSSEQSLLVKSQAQVPDKESPATAYEDPTAPSEDSSMESAGTE